MYIVCSHFKRKRLVPNYGGPTEPSGVQVFGDDSLYR